ncbi:MAG: hypothetical protein ACP5RE_03555 [Candidatus Acidifodinimicrobium sp.]
MDFADLTFEQLIDAIRLTPSLVILNRLADEVGRFSPDDQQKLLRTYESQYKSFQNPRGSFRLGMGPLTLWWKGYIPYATSSVSKSIPPNYFMGMQIDDMISWIKENLPDVTDVVLDSRWNTLMGYSPAPPENEPTERPSYMGRKTYTQVKHAVDAFVQVPTVEDVKELANQEEEEIRREREIDESIRKNKSVPEDIVKGIAKEAKEEVRKIRRIVNRPIPKEIHDLYMRYIGIKPNYINERAFSIFLKKVLNAFPNYEVQEILDRVDFGSVVEAIKEGKKFSEYLQEALDDLLRRMHVNEMDVDTRIQEADELNLRVQLFSRLLDLLFRIYSEYGREEDRDAQRAILRILCENFDICSEEAIENVRKNIPEWVVEHIEYLY